jgi:hypothetical protein
MQRLRLVIRESFMQVSKKLVKIKNGKGTQTHCKKTLNLSLLSFFSLLEHLQ